VEKYCTALIVSRRRPKYQTYP